VSRPRNDLTKFPLPRGASGGRLTLSRRSPEALEGAKAEARNHTDGPVKIESGPLPAWELKEVLGQNTEGKLTL
jgi:hypothetical protein